MEGSDSRAVVRVLIIALAAATLAAAQPGTSADKVAWLARNMVSLRTIDPRDLDFADLRPLGKAIGNARMVLLGGGNDQSTFNAKFRLLRYLHEEMGFDVLTSLTSICDAELLDRAFDRRGPADQWVDSANAVRFQYNGQRNQLISSGGVLDYVRATHKSERPLHIGGFGWGVATSLLGLYQKEAFRLADAIDPKLASPADRKAIRSLMSLCGPLPAQPRARDWQKVLRPGIAALASFSAALARLPADHPRIREIAFCRLTLVNMAYTASLRARRPEAAPRPDKVVSYYAGEWHPGAKIVYWANNQAIHRDFAMEVFGDATFAIAFSEIRNENGVFQVLQAGPEPKLAPAGNDLESLVHATRYFWSFLDFRSLPADNWLRQPLSARLINGMEVAEWPNLYDALFTIDLAAAKNRKE